MDSQEVEILAIGAGPANLALAVALEELAPDLASSTLIVEQHETVLWQRGMLLPWSQSQVSFLKDLVTLRNPRSQYSFISYLHSVGRLNEFINMGSFTPYRLEISDYLQWVAAGLSMVRVQSGRRCLSIEPEIDADGVVSEWLVRMSDGGQIRARNLVFGGGRDPHIPSVFDKLPPSRRIHSTQYSEQITALDPDGAHRIVVLGGAQSAAEMLWASHQQFPKAEVTMVMRSIGLNCYESSRFTNELFYPSFVDEFHDALPEAREQLLREMHRTNYSGLAPSLLEVLYRQMYLERLTGNERMRMRTMVEIADAELVDGEVLLTLLRPQDRQAGTAGLRRGAAGHRVLPADAPDGPRAGRLGAAGGDRGQPQLPAAAAADRAGRLLPAGRQRGHPRHERHPAQRAVDPLRGDRQRPAGPPARTAAGGHHPRPRPQLNEGVERS